MLAKSIMFVWSVTFMMYNYSHFTLFITLIQIDLII